MKTGEAQGLVLWHLYKVLTFGSVSGLKNCKQTPSQKTGGRKRKLHPHTSALDLQSGVGGCLKNTGGRKRITQPFFLSPDLRTGLEGTLKKLKHSPSRTHESDVSTEHLQELEILTVNLRHTGSLQSRQLDPRSSCASFSNLDETVFEVFLMGIILAMNRCPSSIHLFTDLLFTQVFARCFPGITRKEV